MRKSCPKYINQESLILADEPLILADEILRDAGNQVARNFGIVYQLPESMRSVLQGFGIDLPAYNKDETFELPIPATYIIAPDGTVAYAFVEPDFTKRLEPAEIIAKLHTLHSES